MIELAAPNDEAAIRQLLARTPVAGRVTVTFEREPSFFAGCATMGSTCQTLGARADDAVVALACCATREVFINGHAEHIGYLGQLRVDQKHRGRWLVSRGFRVLQELHAADPVPGYLVSIIEGNAEAAACWSNNDADTFPHFHELGRLFTLALAIGNPKPALQSDIEISTATTNDLPALIRFLHGCGARRQFYPVWRAEDFLDSPTTLGLRLSDVLLARRRHEIVGVSGWWDQSSFKQTVVRGYDRWLSLARPFYNVCAPWCGRPPLPAVGEEIRYGYAAFVCIADDDAQTFRALLRALHNLTTQRGCHYLMIGLMERDPLLPLARTYAHIAYPSRLYLAGWPTRVSNEELYERLDQRIPYLEIATL